MLIMACIHPMTFRTPRIPLTPMYVFWILREASRVTTGISSSTGRHGSITGRCYFTRTVCVCYTAGYLAGGSYTNIFYLIGILQHLFYRVLWKTIKAINSCTKLRISWPNTKERQLECATGFTSISTNRALHDCVTVLDGYHSQTITLSKKKYIMCGHTFLDTIKHMVQISMLRATTTVIFYLLVWRVQA